MRSLKRCFKLNFIFKKKYKPAMNLIYNNIEVSIIIT